ncbi:biotin transporter BioY [Nocardia sp. alder85J]|uniref:biotin transporter BioY n=1 Tax=Nocardia sp. alder85J TaxID=2862949 RepID=UPI003A4DA780
MPITMQTLGVMLAGAVLGSVRGMLACALVVLLTAAGLPVLSGGRGGLGVFAGPTAGYLVGWMPGALVTGLIAQFWAWRLTLRRLRIVALFIAAVVGGIAVVYAVGIPWLSANTGIPLHKAFSSGMVFVPGDLLKAAIVALVADGVLRSYRVLPTRPRAAAR